MFNEVQKAIAKLYCCGDMAHVNSMEEAENCGDTLFLFLMRESHDAGTMSEFVNTLATARDQLTDLHYLISESSPSL